MALYQLSYEGGFTLDSQSNPLFIHEAGYVQKRITFDPRILTAYKFLDLYRGSTGSKGTSRNRLPIFSLASDFICFASTNVLNTQNI